MTGTRRVFVLAVLVGACTSSHGTLSDPCADLDASVPTAVDTAIPSILHKRALAACGFFLTRSAA
jgi:hypothetical protein